MEFVEAERRYISPMVLGCIVSSGGVLRGPIPAYLCPELMFELETVDGKTVSDRWGSRGQKERYPIGGVVRRLGPNWFPNGVVAVIELGDDAQVDGILGVLVPSTRDDVVSVAA